MRTKVLGIAIVALALIIGFASCKKEDSSFKLTLEVNIESAGAVAGAGEYLEGETVDITATTNEDFVFINWTKGAVEVSNVPNFTYTMTAENTTLTANYSAKKIVTLGAQDNVNTSGFLSINEAQAYTLEEAFENQVDIDLFCFYEEGNDIAFGGPASNIQGIFGGEDNDPTNWETQNETRFYELEDVTVAEFDALKDGDEAIQTYYNQDEGRKKAKMLTADQIWSIKTKIGSNNEVYVLVKIVEVTDGANGSVRFEYKTK